ncbi:MAG: Quinolinate synthase A [Methanosaeta sp. PtaB.Bin039]|nr:MAG: Quinolinate synthase A [Methanosaeta sp. PtaB.Bin039]OPY46935.1 MAG: Quinolinate synthase A [Methanosaeta sp. PtaU1.Bin028]
MIQEIHRLKKEKDAVILAHNYQIPPVQDLADFVGDSLELSRTAAKIDCTMVLFCGVDFMAETAAILSPRKDVVLPEPSARCPMAQMVTADQVREARELYPEASVVCYVNSTAEVKAESDICCTSANAISVVSSLPNRQVLMVPDENLARYVARHVDKEVIPWNGYCYVHDRFRPDDVLKARRLHPQAELLVHPECRPEVIDLADGVFSTSGMARHAKASRTSEFIIGTENGMLHRLKKEMPQKEFYPLSTDAICQNMKKTTVDKLLNSLRTGQPKVEVPEAIAVRARRAIEKMLAI